MLSVSQKIKANRQSGSSTLIAGKRRSDELIASQFSFDSILREKCKACRLSQPCPNRGECRSAFGNVAETFDNLARFRKTLWGNGRRGAALQIQLEGMASRGSYVDATGSHDVTVIAFHINGKPVCKHFFRVVTGYGRQLFDAIVARVEGRTHEPAERPLQGVDHFSGDIELTRGQSGILAFMQKFYAKDRVEFEPASGDILTVKKSYVAAHEENYKPFCAQALIQPMSYSSFTFVRRNHFPQLKKHKSFKSKCGYNHTGCDVCTGSEHLSMFVKCKY